MSTIVLATIYNPCQEDKGHGEEDGREGSSKSWYQRRRWPGTRRWGKYSISNALFDNLPIVGLQLAYKPTIPDPQQPIKSLINR